MIKRVKMMKRKQVKISESMDITSSLPDEVLGHILSYLPSKTAASTCVLSTRWRNIFTFCRILDLDGSSVKSRDSGRFMDFVDRCIVLMNGAHIDKFRLKCGPYIDTARFNSWICAAIQSNVRELDLCISKHQLSRTLVASPVFLCTTLRVLKLATGSYPLDVPAFVHLPCLVYLKLFVSTGSCYAMKNLHSLSEVHVRVSHSLEPAALPQLFEGIGNVQSLYLLSLLGKRLLMKIGEPLLLQKLTCLRLKDAIGLDLSVLMKFFRLCPNLEEFSSYGRICGEYEDEWADVPSCLPSRLKIIKCMLSYGKLSVERDVALLEYFLDNATVLEKMQIRISGGGSLMTLRTGIEKWETTMETMRKLARSPGRSKTCNLKFIFAEFWDQKGKIFVIEK